MRDVSIVKRKRNQLKEEVEQFKNLKEKLFPSSISYRDLDPEEKKKYGYIQSTIGGLNTQINTLEFVLNEDSEIRDVTEPRFYDFTKEELFRGSTCTDIRVCPCLNGCDY
jgi:hypothetical protein